MKTKDDMESYVRKCGMVPVAKVRIKDYDIFVSDGFIDPFPVINFWPEPKHFPNGAFLTFWWIGRDDILLEGRYLYIDRDHDPELFIGSRQRARINSAIADACEKIKEFERAN